MFDAQTIEEAAADEQRSVQEAAGAVLLDLEMVAKHAPRLLKASLLTPAYVAPRSCEKRKFA